MVAAALVALTALGAALGAAGAAALAAAAQLVDATLALEYVAPRRDGAPRAVHTRARSRRGARYRSPLENSNAL